jgi:hypothetical protein
MGQSAPAGVPFTNVYIVTLYLRCVANLTALISILSTVKRRTQSQRFFKMSSFLYIDTLHYDISVFEVAVAMRLALRLLIDWWGVGEATSPSPLLRYSGSAILHVQRRKILQIPAHASGLY